MTRAAALLAVLLAGCATHIREAYTVHNVDGTRVWYLYKGHDGDDRVLLCEAHDGAPVCRSWPPMASEETARPGSVDPWKK